MSFTQTDLDRLDAAIASGRLSVRDADGNSTTYRSMAELLKAREMVAREVQGDSGGIASRASVGIFTRGGSAPLQEDC